MPARWHVLCTRPHREMAVAERLPGAYVPLARAWRPTWLGRRGRRMYEADKPLLPSYVFLAAPIAAWRPVLDTPGVVGVLMSDGCPAVVAGGELAELRRLARRPPIREGQTVGVAIGPFVGLDVRVLAVDEARHAIGAEVVMLGAARQVRLSVDVLAA